MANEFVVKKGLIVEGNASVTGTVDGRDLATDGTKLDTIESNATATDTTNVVAALTAGTNVTISAGGVIASTDTNTTYVSSDFVHDSLTGFVANEHIDWTGSSAGLIHLTNLPATALTSVQTAIDQASMLALTTQEGDVVVRSDTSETYMRNSGLLGTMADFTLLATPTDAVASVDGATGVVTLNHDTLTGFVANEHIDWTTDQGVTNLHAGNYTDTVYDSTAIDAAVALNTAKVTNVTTDLTKTATTTDVTINSSDGADVAIGPATTLVAGVMTKAVFDEHVVNNTKVSDINHNVTTNLSTTHNASTVVVNSSDGTNATINAATATTAGIMSEAIFDQHVINNAKVSDINHNVTTNLGYTTAATTGTVTSSDGTNATIPAATTTIAGLQTGADKTKLDGIATSANNYTHPTGAGNNHIPSGGATEQVLTYSSSGTAVWADAGGGGVGGTSFVVNTGNSTIAIPAGATAALITAYGGAGGGGGRGGTVGNSGAGGGGGGGGGGAGMIDRVFAVTTGNITVAVGNAGAGNNSTGGGASGNSTTMNGGGLAITCGGGSGGSQGLPYVNTHGNGGAGGAGGTLTPSTSGRGGLGGGGGASGQQGNSGLGGSGGAGVGGVAAPSTGGGSRTAGRVGGGGGGSSSGNNNQTTPAAGDGGSGYVRIIFLV